MRRFLTLVPAVMLVVALAPATHAGASLPVIASISAGSVHTCALTTAGGVKCWGYNADGELGVGTRKNSLTPIDVPRLTSGVSAISAGGFHTCAVTTSGGAKCWGANSFGQLGNGSQTERHVPVNVLGLTRGVAAISAGYAHTCALTIAGGVKCWGANFEGQLGDGTLTNSSVPVDVPGLTSGVSAISAGTFHTCALTTSGGAKCWGSGSSGELGNGGNDGSDIPVDVMGLGNGIAAISAGSPQTCALTTVGGVKCWGSNESGQLGDGTGLDSNVPVDVAGLTSGVSAISTGEAHTCAVTTSGGAKCWGWNGDGQLGDGTKTDRSVPVDVTRFARAATISTGDFHTCALTTFGGVRCWGGNPYGQLGDGTTIGSTVPITLFGPTIAGIDNSATAAPITGSGQIAVTTTWNGVDPYATITSYQAQYQTNGGPWTDVTLESPTTASFTVILAAGNRYNVQIRAGDSLGHMSQWTPGTIFSLQAAQNGSYVGTWVAHQPLAGSWGGSVDYSTDLNASAYFRFVGRNVTWVGTTGPNYGSADVYMDGVYVTTVDCNAASTTNRETLFDSGLLSNAQHTVEIVNLATAGHPRIDIDGFVWMRPYGRFL